MQLSKKTIVKCPCCNSEHVQVIGEIPSSCNFAGKELTEAINGGQLFICNKCNLYFRWPQYTEEEADQYYKHGDPAAWNNSVDFRVDWALAVSVIKQNEFENNYILDVGCSTGNFLSNVSDIKCKKYGIEVNSVAANVAEKSGICIIGKKITDLMINEKYKEFFTVIVAFDIIEHIRCPITFIEQCKALLQPGGYIIISTGNTDSMCWKLAGARYWYCAISEHISFINKKWCEYASKKLEMRIINTAVYSHVKFNLFDKISETITNIIYLLAPSVFEKLRKHGLGKINIIKHPELVNYPPRWMTAKDHIFVVFHKSQICK